MIQNEKEFCASFTLRMSNIIKGVAIIFMLIHHFFSFPEWYVDGLDYSNVLILGHDLPFWCRDSFKVCVSLFAFLTGYSYWYVKNKNYNYSMNKIAKFLANYWLILFGIFLPVSCFLGYYRPSVKSLVLNAFALSNIDRLIEFAWYVVFYCLVMLVLPLFIRILSGKTMLDLVMTLALCKTFSGLLQYILPYYSGIIVGNLSEFVFWFPCVVIGYIMARDGLFEWMYQRFYTGSIFQSIFIIFFVLNCRRVYNVFLGMNLDLIYTPIIVFSLLNLFNEKRVVFMNRILEFIGKHSLNIWFLHALFFSNNTKVLQKYAYLPKQPVLVIVWSLILCILVSIMIQYIMKYINKLIDNIFYNLHCI
ncbi:MAG: acyltransferase family protein [Lachnospiraceae bacterium]